MEGGSKQSINLEAGLDIKSSDMLVPFGQATFQHNWQKWQGKCLPNSLRFEKNGWAAGWNVYNFDFNVFRKKLAENLYAELGQYNTYTKILSLYDRVDAVDSIQDYYIIKDDVVRAGEATIVNNVITGKLNGKTYSIAWNPATHTATMQTTGFSITQERNPDYSTTIIVTDDTSSFIFDVDLLLQTVLSGDTIDDIKYSTFDSGKHNWGTYSYDLATNKVNTPEGVQVTPTLVDNTITFDYSKVITDENISLQYSLESFYTSFNYLHAQDVVRDDKLLIGGNPSEVLAIDKYRGAISPANLVARDEDGVAIDFQLPLWATCGYTITRTDPQAKKCDNTQNFEIAVCVGSGFDTKVKVINVYDESEKSLTLTDNYREKTSKGKYPQYITGLTYRFNQILVADTLSVNTKKWSPNKVLVSSKSTWLSSAKQYRSFTALRSKQLLGDVYEYGNCQYKPSDFFEANDIWDLTVKTNIVYTKDDISNIISIKVKDGEAHTTEGDDLEYFWDNFDIEQAFEDYIAKLTGTVTDYVETQGAQTYAQLYSNGTYIGDTYETVSIDTSEDGFWPFARVPKFNLSLGSQTITGVYWTDGTDYITDLDTFKQLVLGDRDVSIDPSNEPLLENTKYSRTRTVTKYHAGYDFGYIRESDYSDNDKYMKDSMAFKDTWNKYWPDIVDPLSFFDDDNTYGDTRYDGYSDIELIEDAIPDVQYVAPGNYVFSGSAKSLPYGNKLGLIIYNNDSAATMSLKIYHHSKDVTNTYSNAHAESDKGKLKNGDDTLDLYSYFGKNGLLDMYVGNENYTTFTKTKSLANVYSATLCLRISYSKEYDEYGIPYYTESPSSVKDSNWFRYVLATVQNGITSVSCAMNTGVQTIGGLNKDTSDGFKIGQAVTGHSKSRLTYNILAKQSELMSEGTYTLTKVPSSDLSTAEAQYIYYDRDDTAKSQYLFDVIDHSKQPDSNDGTGKYCITLASVNGGYLWYGPRQVDSLSNEEIIKPFYLPGIIYGDPDTKMGNMERVSDLPVMAIKWIPMSTKFPVSITPKFSDLNTLNSAHKFYTEDKQKISNAETSLGEIDVTTLTRPLSLTIDGVQFNFKYNGILQKTEAVDTNKTVIDTAADKVVLTTVSGSSEKATVSVELTLFFNNMKASFYKLLDNSYVLQAADNASVTFKKGAVTAVYNVQRQEIITPKSTTTVSKIPGGHHIYAEAIERTKLSLMLNSVYEGTLSGNIVTFVYKGTTYTFDIAEAESASTGIKVLSTDIRKPNKTEAIGLLRQEGQYQFLKQQWNSTVEVDNFWWVDSSHILELNNYEFVLKRNTKELDDWDGNRFEVVSKKRRDDILPSNIIRYYVTNVYNSVRSAVLFTMKIDLGQILVTIIDPRKAFEVVTTFNITIKKREIGVGDLNAETCTATTAYLNTYNPLTNEQVLSSAQWSNTLIGDNLILGCHMSNNFDQWAVVFNLATKTVSKVVQGYGYVGLHGDLTGGMLPADYVDESKGFNSLVQPLSVLQPLGDKDYNDLDAAYEVGDVDKLNDIEPKVVGDGKQQWYINRKVYGIVSHLTYSNGSFTKQIIPMTNNYTSIYKSPSFSSNILGDAMVQAHGFATLFTFDGAANVAWTSFMALLGYPFLYTIMPRLSALSYLQQTFGQYAYVHYNSSKSPVEKEIGNDNTDSGINEKQNKQTDPVLSNAFTFNKQKFSQTVSSSVDFYRGGILSMCIATFSAGLQALDVKMSVNADQQQTAMTDVGKKYLDNVVANVGDMAAASIMTQAKNSNGITSTVTGLKSLDMFYSTSDSQHVYAGPGFTEHQYVADCVAQSVTDIQVEGKVQMLFFCIRALTSLQLELTIRAEEYAAKALEDNADAMKELTVFGGINVGSAIAVGMMVAAAAMRAAVMAQRVAIEQLEKILDIICQNGITSSVDGSVSKHSLSVEGKHKYGEKNEVFMWPCWGISPGELKYTDESVDCGIRNTPWKLALISRAFYTNVAANALSVISELKIPDYSSNKANTTAMKNNVGEGGAWDGGVEDEDNEAGDCYRAFMHEGDVPYYQATAIGKVEERTLPDDMAKVEGVNRFLPDESFKNENIGMSEPAFAPSMQQDYVIDKSWDLSQYCTYGMQQWVSVKDTKIIDCPPSNMYVNDSFCGVACPYTAIEVKRGIQKAYLRPWAITPTTLALNCTGYNTILDNKLYHAFDGISYRLVDLVGSPGMNKNRQSFWYAFQVNDRFKRSNKVPANELQGNFEAQPVHAVSCIDKLWTQMTIASKEQGLEAGTIGEDKDLIRWAIPVFTEHVSTLPAAVKTLTAMSLGVVEGITSLCVDLANNQTAYKAPLSVDFTIGKNVFRATEEYICSVQTQNGIDVVTDLIPSLGLKFIGSTPTEAFFYSKSTRCYYSFTGSALTKMDMMERFRDIQKGYWDFVNQEVVMPCLMTFKRLNAEVEDKDTETDNIIVPVLSKGQVSGELPPPVTTVFNDRSWYKCVSLPCGFAYQGPNRVIINRDIFVEYMTDSIKGNFGKWKKMNKEKYVTHREYPEQYDNVLTDVQGVDGWTYNPFVLVTSALGASEDTDCLYEWVITFCWPIEMDLLYGTDNFAVVNICAETMTPGGKVKTRPSHVYLTKELFTRNGNYGYYSFRYQSKNGAGNRERLHIWSDQYIAISSIDCEYKVVTSRRTEQLTQQIDVQKLKEL